MDDHLTKRQRQALETKQRIYESAVELFVHFPYDQVKITDICEKAGVSVGVFYHYFPSKGHVFNEGYTNFEKELRTYLAQVEADPIRIIELAVQKYLETNMKKGAAYRSVFLKNQLEIKDSQAIRSVVKNVLSESIDSAVEGGYLEGNGPDIACQLVRALRGFIFEWAMQDGSFHLAEEGIEVARILLNHYRTAKPIPPAR